MAEYAIGDIQGCYNALMRLLEHINFDNNTDRLWFTGDLVNRGPDSLKVLRFIKNLAITPRITLGNHDLHLLKQIFTNYPPHQGDTLNEILNAPDKEELGFWLLKQNILYYDAKLNIVMTHAGIAPMWDLNTAIKLAQELERTLQGANYLTFLENMFGNEPECWDENLTGIDRLRIICNYFTRMRLCTNKGSLILHYKGTIKDAPNDLYPWYETPMRIELPSEIVFGHWSALEGNCIHPKIHAIDTGCLWGGKLTALNLNNKKRYSVTCK